MSNVNVVYFDFLLFWTVITVLLITVDFISSCMNVQANCEDDKEQWVQLLQDGSSTVAGSPYQHTSHESLRYAQSHAVCLLPAFHMNQGWITELHTHSQKYSHSFCILFPFFCFLCSLVVWKAASSPPQTCTWTTPFSSCVVEFTLSPSIQTHPYLSTWYGPAAGF